MMRNRMLEGGLGLVAAGVLAGGVRWLHPATMAPEVVSVMAGIGMILIAAALIRRPSL